MILRLILGVLLVVMAAGQLASFDAMPGIIGAYGLTGAAASTALAVALIAGEALAGVWFLVRPRCTAATPAWIYAAVSAVWAVLAAQAFARGLALNNCGCFGIYATQPLRWFVLVEDALMLLYAGLLLRGSHRRWTSAPASGAADSPSRLEAH